MIVLSIMLLLLLAARILVNNGTLFDLLDGLDLPFAGMLDKYAGMVFTAMIVLLLAKYAIYIVRAIQGLQYDKQAQDGFDNKRYAILAAYPLCDLARTYIMCALLALMINRLPADFVIVGAVVDYLICIILFVAALFIDYFLKDAETIKANLIATAVYVTISVFLFKGLLATGFQLAIG